MLSLKLKFGQEVHSPVGLFCIKKDLLKSDFCFTFNQSLGCVSIESALVIEERLNYLTEGSCTELKGEIWVVLMQSWTGWVFR